MLLFDKILTNSLITDITNIALNNKKSNQGNTLYYKQHVFLLTCNSKRLTKFNDNPNIIKNGQQWKAIVRKYQTSQLLASSLF